MSRFAAAASYPPETSQDPHSSECIRTTQAYITPGVPPGFNHVVGYVAENNPEMLWLMAEPFDDLRQEASCLRVKAAFGTIPKGPRVPPPAAIRARWPTQPDLCTYRLEDLKDLLGF